MLLLIYTSIQILVVYVFLVRFFSNFSSFRSIFFCYLVHYEEDKDQRGKICVQNGRGRRSTHWNLRMPEDILELIYEVFDQIREAEDSKNEILVTEKKRELESLREQLANHCVNKKASSIYSNFLQDSAKISS